MLVWDWANWPKWFFTQINQWGALEEQRVEWSNKKMYSRDRRT